jgi:D-threonate/D-erythronate kinase
MNLVILADDLSGAADCAIGFALAGARTAVTLGATRPAAAEPVDVVAADTNSRRLASAAAARETIAAWHALAAPGWHLYKKIDSTLRGNWVAEVAALREVAGLAIVAPAFPDTGRVMRDARVFVNGTPLHETDTWRLEGRHVHTDVRAMLATEGIEAELVRVDALRGEPASLISLLHDAMRRGVHALVVDAEQRADLALLARVSTRLDGAFFWVGSGGLARELAQLSIVGRPEQPPRAATATHTRAAHRRRAVLVMAGSLSSVTRRQCERLRERCSDLVELTVPPCVLRAREGHAHWPVWQRRIGATLAAHDGLLLRIGADEAFEAAQGPALSESLAALVAPYFDEHVAGLVATGGETARAMLVAAGIETLELITEVEAGVPLARARGARGQTVVTKAGAFGTDDALYVAYQQVKHATAARIVPLQ